MLLMAPKCVDVYLRLILDDQLENLNPLRPVQDLPSFQKKIEIKVIERIKNQDQARKNLSNDRSLEKFVAISQKRFSCTNFDKKYDKKQNEQKS